MDTPATQFSTQALLAGLTRVRRVIDLSNAPHLEVKEGLAFLDKLIAQAQDMLAKPKEDNAKA